jgi:membrane protein implicated in regulation of membrane protease activity
MNDPLVVSAIIGLLGLIAASVIGGTFASLRAARASPDFKITNGLLSGLQSQIVALSNLTVAVANLTKTLADNQIENRQAHEKMTDCLTILVERTKKG